MRPKVEQPLFFSAPLATALPGGVLAAVIVNRLQMRMKLPVGVTESDDRRWVSISRAEWVDELQALRSQRAIMDEVNRLHKSGVILRHPGRCRSTRYSLDENRLREILLNHSREAPELSPEEKVWAAALGSTRRLSARLAKLLTDSQAITCAQVEYWISRNTGSASRVWTHPRSIREWHKLDFPFLGLGTVKEAFQALRDVGLLEESHRSPDPYNRSLSYTVNKELLSEMLATVPVYEPAAQVESSTQRMGKKRSAERDSNWGAGKPPIDEGDSSNTIQNQTPEGQEPPMEHVEKQPMARAEKHQISKEERVFRETEESSSTTTRGINAENSEALDPRILKQFTGGLLAVFFREEPSRKESWSALTNEQVANAFRLADERMQMGREDKRLGTLIKEELDRVCELSKVRAEEVTSEAYTAAREFRGKLAGSVMEDLVHELLEYCEMDVAGPLASVAMQKILELPLDGVQDSDVPEAWRERIAEIKADAILKAKAHKE